MTTPEAREPLVRRALRLEQLSVAWMVVEGGTSITAGLLAQSVALIGFGLDSVLELVSAIALYRRLNVELRGGDAEAAKRSERKALWVVGVTLLLLCAYIAIDSAVALFGRREPKKTTIGFAVTVLALVAMPLLGRAKLQVGNALGSRALVADAKETFACAWLSTAAVVGVGLNGTFGWWWADPVAALAMIPFLIREGTEAVGEARANESRSSHDDSP